MDIFQPDSDDDGSLFGEARIERLPDFRKRSHTGAPAPTQTNVYGRREYRPERPAEPSRETVWSAMADPIYRSQERRLAPRGRGDSSSSSRGGHRGRGDFRGRGNAFGQNTLRPSIERPQVPTWGSSGQKKDPRVRSPDFDEALYRPKPKFFRGNQRPHSPDFSEAINRPMPRGNMNRAARPRSPTADFDEAMNRPMPGANMNNASRPRSPTPDFGDAFNRPMPGMNQNNAARPRSPTADFGEAMNRPMPKPSQRVQSDWTPSGPASWNKTGRAGNPGNPGSGGASAVPQQSGGNASKPNDLLAELMNSGTAGPPAGTNSSAPARPSGAEMSSDPFGDPFEDVGGASLSSRPNGNSARPSAFPGGIFSRRQTGPDRSAQDRSRGPVSGQASGGPSGRDRLAPAWGAENRSDIFDDHFDDFGGASARSTPMPNQSAPDRSRAPSSVQAWGGPPARHEPTPGPPSGAEYRSHTTFDDLYQEPPRQPSAPNVSMQDAGWPSAGQGTGKKNKRKRGNNQFWGTNNRPFDDLSFTPGPGTNRESSARQFPNTTPVMNRTLPDDHPLKIELALLKAKQEQQKAYWAAIGNEQGEEWFDPENYDRARMEKDTRLGETKRDELVAQITKLELGIAPEALGLDVPAPVHVLQHLPIQTDMDPALNKRFFTKTSDDHVRQHSRNNSGGDWGGRGRGHDRGWGQSRGRGRDHDWEQERYYGQDRGYGPPDRGHGPNPGYESDRGYGQDRGRGRGRGRGGFERGGLERGGHGRGGFGDARDNMQEQASRYYLNQHQPNTGVVPGWLENENNTFTSDENVINRPQTRPSSQASDFYRPVPNPNRSDEMRPPSRQSDFSGTPSHNPLPPTRKYLPARAESEHPSQDRPVSSQGIQPLMEYASEGIESHEDLVEQQRRQPVHDTAPIPSVETAESSHPAMARNDLPSRAESVHSDQDRRASSHDLQPPMGIGSDENDSDDERAVQQLHNEILSSIRSEGAVESPRPAREEEVRAAADHTAADVTVKSEDMDMDHMDMDPPSPSDYSPSPERSPVLRPRTPIRQSSPEDPDSPFVDYCSPLRGPSPEPNPGSPNLGNRSPAAGSRSPEVKQEPGLSPRAPDSGERTQGYFFDPPLVQAEPQSLGNESEPPSQMAAAFVEPELLSPGSHNPVLDHPAVLDMMDLDRVPSSPSPPRDVPVRSSSSGFVDIEVWENPIPVVDLSNKAPPSPMHFEGTPPITDQEWEELRAAPIRLTY